MLRTPQLFPPCVLDVQRRDVGHIPLAVVLLRARSGDRRLVGSTRSCCAVSCGVPRTKERKKKDNASFLSLSLSLGSGCWLLGEGGGWDFHLSKRGSERAGSREDL